MTTVTIIGNKPLGPNGENETFPEETKENVDLEMLIVDYIARHGKCSSVMVTLVFDD